MIDKNELIKLLPKLIKEDDKIKGAIISALSSVVSTKNDIERLIEHSDKRFEQMNKRFEYMDKRFDEARKDRLELKVSIGSLGRRSGKNLENAILELLNEKLIQENIQASKIYKEFLSDKDGIIFVENYSTDIDVIMENGKVILMEIKYSPDNRDIFHFLKVAELYNKLKKSFDELILVALEIKKKHLELAQQEGIKVVAGKILL